MIKPKSIFRGLIIGLGGAVLLLELAGLSLEIFRRSDWPAMDPAKDGKTIQEAKAKAGQIESRLRALAPRGIYLLIDTAENRLKVMNGTKVEREVVVSCGSGDILEDLDGKRKWQFDTPRGEFSVTSKLVNPTWIKPDWAFIEEGEKPPTNFNARVDNDSLGDFALGFGDGYFIHGTLYTRLLGRNVTHGCVRVGDKDLKAVFDTVPMGARIFIY